MLRLLKHTDLPLQFNVGEQEAKNEQNLTC